MTEILSGAMVVTGLAPIRIVERDLVIADDGRVAASADDAAIAGDKLSQAMVRRDCSGCMVVPGNVCAHTHLYSALARGMPYELAPPENFLETLQRIWWRLDRALDEESIRASALAGGMEALLSGTTTLVDHHASPNAIDGSLDVIEEALSTLGVRSVLCYEVTDRDGPERADAGVAENVRFLDRVHRERPPLARGMVGAHASFTLSAGTLAACAEAAAKHGVGLHVHAAEDRIDTHAVSRLVHAAALDDRTLLAHGVHLDGGDLELVGEAGATIAHNARSNMNNAVGRAAVATVGERLALGTDGIGSDMFEESRAAYFRLREDDLSTAPDWPLARLAESSRLAGRTFEEPLLGTLDAGAPADLVVLDYASPAPVREASFPGHWIFGLASRHVRDVMVGGTWVVRERRLVLADADELAAEARRAAEALWARLDAIETHPYEPEEVRSWR